jgi:hypothetical protein
MYFFRIALILLFRASSHPPFFDSVILKGFKKRMLRHPREYFYIGSDFHKSFRSYEGKLYTDSLRCYIPANIKKANRTLHDYMCERHALYLELALALHNITTTINRTDSLYDVVLSKITDLKGG